MQLSIAVPLATIRIAELNHGQLRLLVKFCETKVNSLRNATVLDAYRKLLKKAVVENEKRLEEEVQHDIAVGRHRSEWVRQG